MFAFKRLVPALASTVLLGGLAVGCEPSEEREARAGDAGPRPVKTVVMKAKGIISDSARIGVDDSGTIY